MTTLDQKIPETKGKRVWYRLSTSALLRLKAAALIGGRSKDAILEELITKHLPEMPAEYAKRASEAVNMILVPDGTKRR